MSHSTGSQTDKPEAVAALPGGLPASFVGNLGRLGLAELGVGKNWAGPSLAVSGVSEVIKNLATRNAQLAKMADPLAHWNGSAALSAARLYADQTRLLSQLVPDRLIGGMSALGLAQTLSIKPGFLSEYAASIGLAQSSSLTQVLRTSETFQQDLAKWHGARFSAISAGLDSTSLLASRAHGVAERLTPVVSRADLKLMQPSAASFRALDAYTRSLSSAPTLGQVVVAGWGAQAATGLLSGAAIAVPIELDSPADIALDELLSDDAFHGTGQLLEDLLPILDSVDPRAREHILGAFEALDNRFAAVPTAAHMLVETIDWLFRSAAPEELVLLWAQDQEPRFRKQLVYKPASGVEKPTLTAKVRYVVRHRDPSQQQLTEAQVKLVIAALPQLREAAEGEKHGGAGRGSVGVVRSMAVTLVGLLGMVFTQP